MPFYDTLRQLLNVSFTEVKSLTEGLARGRIAETEEPARGKLVLPSNVGPLMPVHVAYLASRGLSEADAALWGLRGLNGLGRLRWRLFVPIVHRGEVVSWTTRAVSETAGIRYLSASAGEEKYDHKDLLGGEQLVSGHAVCAVEGPFDAFRIGPGAVWLSGTGYRRSQMLRLARYPVRVVCFDNSAEAQAKARKLVRELEGFDGVTYNVTLDAKDPGCATHDEVLKIKELLR